MINLYGTLSHTRRKSPQALVGRTEFPLQLCTCHVTAGKHHSLSDPQVSGGEHRLRPWAWRARAWHRVGPTKAGV